MAGCVSRTVHAGQLSLECQVNSALHPSGVAESSTSCGWGKGGNVTSAGWQVTLCDPMWHVSYRSGVATLRTAIHLLLTYLLTYLRGGWWLECAWCDAGSSWSLVVTMVRIFQCTPSVVRRSCTVDLRHTWTRRTALMTTETAFISHSVTSVPQR